MVTGFLLGLFANLARDEPLTSLTVGVAAAGILGVPVLVLIALDLSGGGRLEK